MKSLLALLVFALVVPPGMEAQAPGLTVGARVRVTSPLHHFNREVATITELHGDSIVLTGKMGTRTVALENVTALDVSTGLRTQVGRSALIGLGAGALLGGIVGAVSYEEPDFFFGSAAQMGAVSALFFGGIGMVAGAVVGAVHRTDRWERRDVPLRAAIRGSRSETVTLRLSRSF